MGTHLLLLRGVNVGGRNRLPMADLRALLAGLGAEDVATYLQSGNAVCRAPGTSDALAARLADAVEGQLGLTVGVLGRSADRWAGTVAANPLAGLDDDPRRLHVSFLDAPADPGRLDALVTEARGFAPERLEASGCDLYLHIPGGYHQAKLSNAFLERRLGRIVTTRNWRTVLALADLAGVGA